LTLGTTFIGINTQTRAFLVHRTDKPADSVNVIGKKIDYDIWNDAKPNVTGFGYLANVSDRVLTATGVTLYLTTGALDASNQPLKTAVNISNADEDDIAAAIGLGKYGIVAYSGDNFVGIVDIEEKTADTIPLTQWTKVSAAITGNQSSVFALTVGDKAAAGGTTVTYLLVDAGEEALHPGTHYSQFAKGAPALYVSFVVGDAGGLNLGDAALIAEASDVIAAKFVDNLTTQQRAALRDASPIVGDLDATWIANNWVAGSTPAYKVMNFGADYIPIAGNLYDVFHETIHALSVSEDLKDFLKTAYYGLTNDVSSATTDAQLKTALNDVLSPYPGYAYNNPDLFEELLDWLDI
jgi:hypothetical protein